MRIDRRPRWIRLFGYAAALVSGVIMGLSWVVFKLELNSPHLGPADVNWLNMIGVAAIIWPVYLIRNRGDLFPPDKPYRWLGLFALVAASIFYLRNVGVDLCGATTAAIVSRVEAGFVFIFSYIIVRQRVSVVGWLGSAILVAGALRTIGIGSAELSFDPVGIAALLGAALFIAINAVIIKLKFSRVPNEMVILASATVQTIVFSIAVPTLVGLKGVVAVLHSPRLIGLVILGAASIAVNLFLYYYAMKRAPMWAVRMLALVALPSAVIGDYLILHQPITMNAVQGMLLVMAGAAMIILPSRRARSPDEEAALPRAAEGESDE
ncbi:MAG: DMT family transporter [Armatimonadota bacterium]